MGPGEVIARRFEVIDWAASGGMGSVYRGRDRDTGDAVAIKLLHRDTPLDLERFRREVEILASLSHPGIARYVAHGTTRDGGRYLVQGWLDGVTLADRLASVGVSAAEALACVEVLARALSAAHERGVVHRDVKPSNAILRGAPARPVLIDFGIALPEDRLARLTATGAAIGTPAYMAPEQARGVRDIDPRADLFGLGCVLYECLAARPAFPGTNSLAIRAKVLHAEPTPLVELWPAAPAALAELVERLLAKDRDARPSDAAAVADALSAVVLPPGEADTRRRRSSARPTQTYPFATLTEGGMVTAEPGGVCFVFAAGARAAPETLAALSDLLCTDERAVEVFGDGSVLVRVHAPRDPAARVEVGLEVARAIADRLPDAAIAVAAAELGSHLAITRAIEWGGRAVEAAGIGALFADAAADRVLLDRVAAGLVADRFPLAQRADGSASLPLASLAEDQG